MLQFLENSTLQTVALGTAALGVVSGSLGTFAVLRRQQQALFLPGLRKLGLDRLPHALACAQYHYLSNAIGGVSVEWIGETDRKSWVRYPPPRWMWAGTAIAGARRAA